MSNILVIEDDAVASSLLENGLKKSGYSVTVAQAPSIATATLRTDVFDVIILDIGLPEMNGYEYAKELRRSGYKGHILMLSSLNLPSDIIRGLDAGADHYMTKPFEFNVLTAQIRSMIRRKHADTLILKNGDLEMDLVGRTVSREGKKIDLTTREFGLLEFLMRHRDKVVDRNAIARQVWGSEFDPDSNVIDVYINHLRKKIDSPFTLKILKTVVGHGYILNKVE